MRDDLAKVAVVSILDGAVNEKSVLEVLPFIINILLVGPISPMNDCSFLVPLSSRDQVKEVCKLDVMKVVTKDGLCSLKVAPWSAEFGQKGRKKVLVNGCYCGISLSMLGHGW